VFFFFFLNADKMITSKPVKMLSYESPYMVDTYHAMPNSEEPEPPASNSDDLLRKCTPKICMPKLYIPNVVHAPKGHMPRAHSSHSSSGSSSSSGSMLSWLPTREPLTPRFNHLLTVLEGNAKRLEEVLPQWPPEVKIGLTA